MAASLTNHNYISNVIDKTGAQFDDLAKTRGRSTRAASLALPNNSILDLLDKEQTVLDPVKLLPTISNNIRRHSSHYCPMIDDPNILQTTAQPKPKILPLVPPPVPKRTFQGKLTQKSLQDNNVINSSSYSHHKTTQDINTITSDSNTICNNKYNQNHYNHHQQQQHHLQQPQSDGSNLIINNEQNYFTIGRKYNSSRVIKYQPPIKKDYDLRYSYRDNDNHIIDNNYSGSVESVFDDTPANGDDLVLFERTKQPLGSNRSSSDSNKSQTTIDTGYMSSSNDNDRVLYSTGNENRGFRSRFSSEDTQSSIDSYISLDYQRGGTDSPQNKYNTDSPYNTKNRTEFTFDRNYPARYPKNNDKIMTNEINMSSNNIDNKSPKSNRGNDPESPSTFNRRLPAVPVRRQPSLPPKLPPPISTTPSKSRGTPPVPPLRTQGSLDSGKLIHNGHILGAFQTNDKTITSTAKTGEQHQVQEMFTRPLPVKKGPKSNRPPPLNQIHHSKINLRQDSSISNDSFSLTSSPGYNSKSMEAPLLQHASKINKTGIRHQDSNDSFGMTTRNNNFQPAGKFNMRQDSNISSDSFSQTSSPSYNTKLMEAPLLSHTIKINNLRHGFRGADEITKEIINENNASNVITKSASTPASLQTIVRFQNGSNMSLQHKIIKARKNSNPYVTQGRLKFRLCQILLNAVALLAIAGGLAAYFNAYPTVKFINKTIITPVKQSNYDNMNGLMELNDKNTGKNPMPGVCLPIIVKFCQNHQIPYNYTVFPNYIGHFGQPEAQIELDAYDALVDVRCYELVSLFLCSLFVPKCSQTGITVSPCRSLCYETLRRCGFFFGVFGLELPDYLTCDLFTDSNNIDECVGAREVREARFRAQNPACSGFLCDQKRCIPADWQCDGHVDCLDQTDESKCDSCNKGSIYCGDRRCMSQKHVCDGVQDCPWGQDERNCIRLSERNGDLGRGILEVYKADEKQWAPACVIHWDPSTSASVVCSMLGYSSVNSTKLTTKGTNLTITPPTKDSPAMWRMYQKKHTNLMKEFTSCPINSNHPVVELTCSNFECGKIRNRRQKAQPQTRIVGGREALPGDWPFLAAILGGPEEIFYCAGVLIADQWVLTASHCIGNHTLRNINDWTIQLGITRRLSHTYYGQKVKVKHVIPHPQYNSNVAHDNDIALFQLSTRVAFHEHLLPVCLPPAMREIKTGTLCTVIGWGKREDKNANPGAASAKYEPVVNEVQVPVINRELCNEWLETLNVTEGMICAGYQEGGRDACQGDSGGPLLCRDPNDKERWFVGGIVSWGIMCAHPKLPGVYANVPKYIPWIMQQIHKHSIMSNENFGQ